MTSVGSVRCGFWETDRYEFCIRDLPSSGEFGNVSLFKIETGVDLDSRPSHPQALLIVSRSLDDKP